MKIYIVIVNDRHSDIDAYTFTDQETAISEARRFAKDRCNYQEDYEEKWIEDAFFIAYSSEEDYVLVVTKELDSSIG